MTIDVSFIARNITPSETYREHVRERVGRLEHLASGAHAIEVKTSKPSSQRHSEHNVKVEVTLRGDGTVVRTEAEDDDKTAAFDKAFHRLSERLRRMHDRRKDRRKQASVAEATADMVPVDSNVSLVEQVLAARKAEEEAEGMDVPEDTPVRIREKAFPATPMTVDEAVDAMELVGHDFYLFQNSETGVPGVVYRRQGWQYGVISLDESLPADHVPDGGRDRGYGESKAGAAE